MKIFTSNSKAFPRERKPRGFYSSLLAEENLTSIGLESGVAKRLAQLPLPPPAKS